jgi:hypothetical protein
MSSVMKQLTPGFVWLLSFAAIVPAASKSQKAPVFKIAAIKALLFYEDKGTFSKDILADPNFALWNTIIGGGSAEGHSTSTLIIVELSGGPESYEPSRQLEFTATYKSAGKNARPIIVKRITDTGIFNKQGNWFAAFWLYDTGCEPVKLSARILGQPQPSAMTKRIGFQCGE